MLKHRIGSNSYYRSHFSNGNYLEKKKVFILSTIIMENTVDYQQAFSVLLGALFSSSQHYINNKATCF